MGLLSPRSEEVELDASWTESGCLAAHADKRSTKQDKGYVEWSLFLTGSTQHMCQPESEIIVDITSDGLACEDWDH